MSMDNELNIQEQASLSLSTRLALFWRHGDQLFKAIIILAAALVIVLGTAIGYELWINSELSRKAFGLSFLFYTRWDPAIDRMFGAFPFIQGTLVTSFIALLVAVPISLGVAIFLAELAPTW